MIVSLSVLVSNRSFSREDDRRSSSLSGGVTAHIEGIGRLKMAAYKWKINSYFSFCSGFNLFLTNSTGWGLNIKTAFEINSACGFQVLIWMWRKGWQEEKGNHGSALVFQNKKIESKFCSYNTLCLRLEECCEFSKSDSQNELSSSLALDKSAELFWTESSKSVTWTVTGVEIMFICSIFKFLVSQSWFSLVGVRFGETGCFEALVWFGELVWFGSEKIMSYCWSSLTWTTVSMLSLS